MLGTEYSWLISVSAPEEGMPRVRLAGTALLTVAVAVFCLVGVSLRAESTPRALLREAAVAAKAGDVTTVMAKLEAARALRPDYPRVLNNLARCYLQAGRVDDAMVQLREMAAMGLSMDVARDEAFTALRSRPDFTALVNAFAANVPAPSPGNVALELPAMTGIVEGFAIHTTTRESYFSDVHNRCIWYRDASGDQAVMKKFSADADGLQGVFALKIDPEHNILWASCSAVPEMKDYSAANRGQAFLAAYSLASRRLLKTYPLPADDHEHVLGDFIIAADGTLYASDSSAPVIWRLVPGATALEKWLSHDDFVSLQGLAFSANGRELYVSDYANGLWRINLASKAAQLLSAPAHTTLFGIDGLYAVPDGLLAVQNGINPQRVIRITLGPDGVPTAVKPLSTPDPATSDLALGQVIDGHFDFVGNSGWALFEKPTATPAPRTVALLHTSLE